MSRGDHERYADPAHRYGHSNEPDHERCRWEVWSSVGAWSRGAQCSRRATVDGLWCKQHSPEATAARKKAKDDRDRAENEKLKAMFARIRLQKNAVSALRRIAAGDLNDAAGYAQMVLDGESPE